MPVGQAHVLFLSSLSLTVEEDQLQNLLDMKARSIVNLYNRSFSYCHHVSLLSVGNITKQDIEASKLCSSKFEDLCHSMPISISANSSIDQEQEGSPTLWLQAHFGYQLRQNDEACIAYCNSDIRMGNADALML